MGTSALRVPMSEAKLWIDVMRASSGQELRKYVSRNAEYDSGLGISSMDWDDQYHVKCFKAILTGNAAAADTPILHRNTRLAILPGRYKLVVWAEDIGLCCPALIAMLDKNRLLGVPQSADWWRRKSDIEQIYKKPGRVPQIRRPTRVVRPDGIDCGEALAYVCPLTKVKWAKAGIGFDVPQGVVTARVFNECSRAYAIYLGEWVAAETLAGMKRTLDDRIKIVPYPYE